MMDVVTAVIERKGKILLLKRGNRVRTYKGKWACVSGYREGNENPLDRAIKEIEEEIGIEKSEIRLLKSGNPIEFRDAEGEWRVYPFLFTTEKSEIKIDWEHTEYRWIEPYEIEKYDTVPKLKEAIYSLLDITPQKHQ